MDQLALIFLSCGQRKGEREYALEIQKVITDEFHFRCYNADSQQGFESVKDILKHLSQADYYLFIDFKREGKIPISVFSHQEYALANAWGITKILAFREKDTNMQDQKDRYESCGLINYLLTHPIEFDRTNLVEQVRQEIGKKIANEEWQKDYSRNLVVTPPVVDGKGFMSYTDHSGKNTELIWHIKVENHRTDCVAFNTIVILDGIWNKETQNYDTPDRSKLKCTGQKAYEMNIFPESDAKFDAFTYRSEPNPGIYLHSTNDIFPRAPIIDKLGIYFLKYRLYSESFPPIEFYIQLNYDQNIAPEKPNMSNITAKLINKEDMQQKTIQPPENSYMISSGLSSGSSDY